MKYAMLGLSLALAAGCASVDASETGAVGTAIGETVYVDGPSVTPLEVIEDSRCPVDAACVWEGQLILRARVSGGAWQQEMELKLGEPRHVADGALLLVSAAPAPQVDVSIAPEDYRFAFEFAGGL